MDRFIVSRDDDGRRLDKVIRQKWPALPLGAMMKAFRKKLVRIDGKRGSFDYRLEEGQEVLVPWEEAVEKKSSGIAGHLITLYKDDVLWVINKPAGLLSQPDVKGGDSVSSRAHASQTGFLPQPVHRLDRNTSGVLAIAMGGKALRELARIWKDGDVHKVYWAVLAGVVPEEGVVEVPLLKDGDSNTVRVDESGQSALTVYRKIFSDGENSLCEIVLATGRSHQIRVHMAHIGHPVLGDRKYGVSVRVRSMPPRPLLHARELVFPELSGELDSISGLRVVAPLPGDMLKVVNKMADSAGFNISHLYGQDNR